MKCLSQVNEENKNEESKENKESKAEMMLPQRDLKGDGLADNDVETVHYWIYAPGDGACKWDEFYRRGVMGLGWGAIGDFSQYSSKIGRAHV